jgi:alpha-L-rhamnosidase
MPGMNSFNHYAFGAVDEWMWRNIVGINPDEQKPGFKHFVIRPEVGGNITWARGEYKSIRGPIRSSWKVNGKRFTLRVSVPPNTSATVYLPAGSVTPTLSAKNAGKGGPLEVSNKGGPPEVFEIGSGDYEFTVDLASSTVAAGR